jgi:hypothetical protein
MAQADIVQHYRYLRGIAADIQNAALNLVPHATLLEFGRRLGVVRKGEFTLEDDEDEKLLDDLAIHMAWQGRSRALDRYALTVPFQPGSDGAHVLAALQNARFTALEVEAKHEVAGVIARDMLTEQSFHLMDVALGMSGKPKSAFVGRLVEIDGFQMSCITLVPATQVLFRAAMQHWPA